MRRKRERGRGVVPPCGGGGRRGEGWCHREEEEGEGRGVVPSWVEEEERERGGAVVRRKGERVGPIVGRRGREGEGWCHRGLVPS